MNVNCMKNLSNENWISCKKVGLPSLYIVSENNFRSTYRSEKVLVQTKRDEMFVAYCEKKNMQIKDGMMKLNGLHMEQVEEEW